MKTLLKILGVCGVLFLILLLTVCVAREWPWLFGSKPQLRQEIPVRIQLAATDWQEMGDDKLSTLTPESSYVGIVDALRNARSSREHQCINFATMIFYYRDGQSVRFGLLPGHHSSRYEFRYNHLLYSMPRLRFFGALKAAGIDPKQISGNEVKERDMRLLDAAIDQYSVENSAPNINK